MTNAKLFALAAAVLMAVTAGAFLVAEGADEADAADDKCGERLYWSYDSSTTTLTIIGDGPMTDYTNVTAPPWSAYIGAMTTIVFPTDITTIGDKAFKGCTAITPVAIPDNVESIGSEAFSGCTSLATLTIGDGTVKIGDNAFSGCTALTTLTIGKGTVEIGDNAFKGCNTLASVAIPDNVESIGPWAFSGCTSLATLTIGNGTVEIGEYAFRGCNVSSSLNMPSSLQAIGDYAFQGSVLMGSGASLSFGPNLKTIGRSAFENCALTADSALYIPSSVSSIGSAAFANMSKLKTLTFGAGLCQIGDAAFKGCANLESLTLSGAGSIGKEAFSGTAIAGTLEIPASVTSIGKGAFSSIATFGVLKLNSGLQTIGEAAFKECNGITSTVAMPSTLVDIGSDAFSGCKKAGFSFAFSDKLMKIGDTAFKDCGSTGSGIVAVDLTIPKSVQSIGASAFEGCTIIKSLKITSSLILGVSAFKACTNLAKVSITGSTLSVPANCFNGCGLTELDFNKTFFISIGTDAFPNLHDEAGNPSSGGLSNTWEISGCKFEKTSGEIRRTTHILMYNPNGGTGTQQRYLLDSDLPTEITLEKCGYVKENKVFAGWALEDDGTTYETKVTLNNGSKTVYAGWVSGVGVSFNANGGTGTMDPIYVVPGVPSKLPTADETTFVPPLGAVFGGWVSTPTGTTPMPTITTSAATTVYALWVGTYTISYDSNGGTGTQDSDYVAPGSTFRLPSTTTFAAPAGKTFCGWGLSPDETMPIKELSFVMENKRVYALWGLDLYTVDFRSTGSGTQASIEVVAGGTAKLPATTTFTAPTDKGFYGWSLTQDGSIISQIPNVGEDKTVHAVWKTQWTVTFKPNGGTGTQDPIKAWSGMDVALPSEPDFKAPKNCTFEGWSEEKDGKTITKIESIDCNTTLYAIWLEDGKYRITLDVETLGSAAGPGGTVSGEGSYYKDAEVRINAYAKSGFVFVQWDDGNLKASRTITVKSDDTFTAQFRSSDAVSHYVEFDTQDGSKQPSDEEVYEGEWMIVPDYRGTKAGYTFDCWVCDGDEYDAGDKFLMGKGDAVFTAKWIKNEEPAPDNTPLIIGGAIAGITAVAAGLFVFARFRL